MPTSEQKRRQRRLGARLKQARIETGMTEEELAIKLTDLLDGEETVSQSTVSYWQSGRSVPTPAKVRALEALLPLRRGEIAEILEPERFSSSPESDRRSGPDDRRSPTVADVVREELQGVRAGMGKLAEQMEQLTGWMEQLEQKVDRSLRPPTGKGRAGGGGRT